MLNYYHLLSAGCNSHWIWLVTEEDDAVFVGVESRGLVAYQGMSAFGAATTSNLRCYGFANSFRILILIRMRMTKVQCSLMIGRCVNPFNALIPYRPAPPCPTVCPIPYSCHAPAWAAPQDRRCVI